MEINIKMAAVSNVFWVDQRKLDTPALCNIVDVENATDRFQNER